MSPARRAVLAAVVTSYLGWTAFEVARGPNHPLMDLSDWYADQTAHMNAGRLWWRYGSAIWKQPVRELVPRPTPQQRQEMPDDVRACDRLCKECLFVVPGWAKPVLVPWWHVVRFYPPGDLVLTAPVALLYQLTALTLIDANRLLLLLFLACAHLGLWLLLDLIVHTPGMGSLAFLPAYLSVNALIHWTLEGFYDGAIIFPLLLCWYFLGQRRGLAAIVAYSVAVFLHFRSYYYGPWGLAAAMMVLHDRQWRLWRMRDWVAVTVAALLAGASLLTFHWVLSGLLAEDMFLSPLLITQTHFEPTALWLGAGISLLAVLAFVRAGAWMDAILTAWIFLLLTQVRQTFAWYQVALVPWLSSIPRSTHVDRTPLVFGARVILFIFLSLYVHGGSSHLDDALLPTWIPSLFR